jgi:hypothetical protein
MLVIIISDIKRLDAELAFAISLFSPSLTANSDVEDTKRRIMPMITTMPKKFVLSTILSSPFKTGR